jgi:DNA-directed RNA polymerase
LILSKFSISYSNFIEEAFPNITKQIKLLNNSVKELVSTNQKIELNTLDGCTIDWSFSAKHKIRRSYYNPILNKQEQITLVKYDDTCKKNVNKHILSFLPNFVHSIDASIMRLLINKLSKKTKNIPSHIHDCVLLHPNDVDTFYDIVTEIYCNKNMSTLANDLIFACFKKNTVGDIHSNIINIELEFNKNKEQFNINPKYCYKYEGSK